jgi:hypothetical protein
MLRKIDLWRLVTTQYDRFAHTSMSAIVVTAIMLLGANGS